MGGDGLGGHRFRVELWHKRFVGEGVFFGCGGIFRRNVGIIFGVVGRLRVFEIGKEGICGRINAGCGVGGFAHGLPRCLEYTFDIPCYRICPLAPTHRARLPRIIRS